MQIEYLALRGSASISKPQTLARPPVLLTSPARMLMSVDLPAPLGTSRPNICPRGTSKLTRSSAGLPRAYILEAVSRRLAASDMAGSLAAGAPPGQRHRHHGG